MMSPRTVLGVRKKEIQALSAEPRHPGATYRSFVAKVRLGAERHLRPCVIHRQVQWVLDALLGAAAMLLAYVIRFDGRVPATFHTQMWAWAAAMFLLEPAMISLGHGYRSTWRHFGLRDLGNIAIRQAAILTLLLLLVYVRQTHWMPVGVAVIQVGLAALLLCGIRTLRRIDHEATVRMVAPDRVLLVGTAASASAAVRQLQSAYGTRIVGMIVDESGWEKLRINGVPVLGTIPQLGAVLARNSISLLLLSSSDLTSREDIIQVATDLGVTLKLLPSVHDVVGDAVRVHRMVPPTAIRKTSGAEHGELHGDVAACLQHRTVLVSGAAGSIGSELVRQVKATEAARLLLLDQDENGMFELLNRLGADPRIVPVIGDIRDADVVRNVFRRERPDVVLHAAAYKHVPLMEQSPCEAVLNNVIGTRTLAEAAVDFGVERFVMISSDKAVNPTSMMGASKRLAEIVIQDLANRTAGRSQTHFACVRFGNVLGSRGSVLPIFMRQIEHGGPLTVTNEQMTRYFMTIPQAVSLVLRAATLASRGDIYMLDMGDPVLIVQFARELIQLAGLRPDTDIEIRIVGSRPGEKLHEELWSEHAEVSATIFRHIFRVKQEQVATDFPQSLAKLELEARNHDPEQVRQLMHRLAINYRSEQCVMSQPEAVL